MYISRNKMIKSQAINKYLGIFALLSILALSLFKVAVDLKAQQVDNTCQINAKKICEEICGKKK